MMATNVATALDIEFGDGGGAQALRPVTWDEWTTTTDDVIDQYDWSNYPEFGP